MSVNELQLAELLKMLREQMRLEAQFSAEPNVKLTQQGFVDFPVMLNNTKLPQGLPLPVRGFQITYLRRGSTPGGLLLLKGGAGIDNAPFGVGEQINGWFEGGDIKLTLAPGSVAAGKAVLRIATQPRISFRESPVDVPVDPVALLGSLIDGVVTYVSVTEDVVPSGAAASVVGAFNCTGWRRVIVLIDTGGALTTSFQINPFYQVPGGTTWHDEGATELKTITDTNPSAGQLRCFVWELSQAQGSCYPAIRNLLPGGQTQLSFCILGVG